MTTLSTDSHEVMIEVDYPRGFMTRFGKVGRPPYWREGASCVDPIFLVSPDIVAACLRTEGFSYDGITGFADHAGNLSIESPAGTWKYELWPACWSDDAAWRNSPPVYLAVWPD